LECFATANAKRGPGLALSNRSDAHDSTTEMEPTMACPYLKEVVMLSCEAFHVKKMVPLDRIATGNPCLGEFRGCPFFQECTSRLVEKPPDHATSALMARKEGSQ
jgi:hypothetical protein